MNDSGHSAHYAKHVQITYILFLAPNVAMGKGPCIFHRGLYMLVIVGEPQ